MEGTELELELDLELDLELELELLEVNQWTNRKSRTPKSLSSVRIRIRTRTRTGPPPRCQNCRRFEISNSNCVSPPPGVKIVVDWNSNSNYPIDQPRLKRTFEVILFLRLLITSRGLLYRLTLTSKLEVINCYSLKQV